MQIKKALKIGLILAITHASFYMLGSVINRKQMLHLLALDFDKTNASVNLGRYVEYRDIAAAIKAGDLSRAICISELGENAMYNDIKSCLANQGCSIVIKENIREAAPEILDQTPLKFDHIKRKGNIISCTE